MKTRLMLTGLLLASCLTGQAQTLFTYGGTKADAAEFLRAYTKNNNAIGADKAGSMREYLDLYINSRLKIREAFARGYDTLPQIRTEVENLRVQIIENYINDPEAINRLTREAFKRSQKDVHAAHIFLAFRNTGGIADTTAAYAKLQQVLKALPKQDFLSVAQQYSDDPSAKTNKGDLGFVTAFTLPYVFENLVYQTAVGKHSRVYRSGAGYHIFKNIGERKALGKMKAQQILLAFPPDADQATRNGIKSLADSLYAQLKKGADFTSFVNKFSNDYISVNTGGTMPDISVGQFDQTFENNLWSLKKDGEVGKPFMTNHGWHILKRISVKPVSADSNNTAYMEQLRMAVKNDDRWTTVRDFIYDEVVKKAGVKRIGPTDAALWAFSDSLLDYKPAGPAGSKVKMEDVLLRIGKTDFNVEDWIVYSRNYRFKPDRSGVKTYNELTDEYIKAKEYDYYRNNLEDFNADFRAQMNEFLDGNLFFEIMQQEIWNKAQTDSASLLALYQKRKEQYNWKPSAEAVIFFCNDEAVAKTLQNQIKQQPTEWRTFADALVEKVVADSARYEWEQLPGIGNATPKEKTLTPLSVNKQDNSATFAYIFKVHPQAGPRSFAEAKGLVINDQQSLLEEAWMAELKKKYPVHIDQQVWEELVKRKAP
ncbi:peptidylprolyl isomerase [Terrimonas ferruginea]|uniref:peptidylprolyl isomerase n=1 Tax=Terrimonas ferruginea TaxID=249 RepID=UPI0009DB871B|nr:peptidylprolyl isomerase [Terrimonas ferruginea]